MFTYVDQIRDSEDEDEDVMGTSSAAAREERQLKGQDDADAFEEEEQVSAVWQCTIVMYRCRRGVYVNRHADTHAWFALMLPQKQASGFSSCSKIYIRIVCKSEPL